MQQAKTSKSLVSWSTSKEFEVLVHYCYDRSRQMTDYIGVNWRHDVAVVSQLIDNATAHVCPKRGTYEEASARVVAVPASWWCVSDVSNVNKVSLLCRALYACVRARHIDVDDTHKTGHT